MERSEVKAEYKWKTSDLFASDEDWEKEYAEAEKTLCFSEFKGKLGEASAFLAYLAREGAAAQRLERLYLYAHMNHDADTRDSACDAMRRRAEKLLVGFSSETAFAEPELTALPAGTLESYAADPRFAEYDYRLSLLIKGRKYVLSEGEERLLALGGEMYGGFRDAFTVLNNADLDFPEIEAEGKKTRVTHGTYSVLMQSPDRELRRRAFAAYYGAFSKVLNTLSAIYAGSVNKDVFLTRARGYTSCLERALTSEDVPPVVYENLLAGVRAALPDLHRYVRAKARALGISDMHMYDIYVPAVEGADLKPEYEQAFDLVIEGLSPLGEEYGSLLRRARDEGWIDVFETEGKRSGAYSTGAFGVHPYVLLNYQKTTHDVFTIAHELGHAMHTYFSNRTQPYAKADYRIFVAEVASTVNEVLLLRSLLARAEDAKLKKYLLGYLLEMIRTTLFRQTQFAEFEYEVHAAAERGEAITRDELDRRYYALNKAYYGEDAGGDPEIAHEWARIPHFYTSFYVYKYATGLTSALAIADRILSEGQPAADDYFRFLSSGGSDSPVNLLKQAGVDLTESAPFERAMNVFRETLAAFEEMN